MQDFRPTLHSIVSGRSHNRSGLKRLPEISQVPVDTLSYPTQYQFLNQTTLDLRKEKWTFLNREFTVMQEMTQHQRSKFSLSLYEISN